MRKLRGLLVPALAVSLLAAVAACGGGSGSDGKTKIIIGTFGEFGYEDLYKAYEKAHPDVDIVERVSKAEDHHKNMAAHLATGKGAADIEAIEEGWIGQFKASPNKFNDLNKLGAADLKSQWPEWKWESSVAKTGEQIGLGTDVGGMAMCYRKDLFQKAGLPTDRAAVSALWPTWDGYIDTGKKFIGAKVPGSAFFDSPDTIYRSILGQADEGLYSRDDKVVVESNPAVRAAFDKTAEALDAKLSAKITPWSPEWNAGFQKGAFATIACPSWMMAFIQDQAKSSAGKWDIASVPGGGGNWGGSFLTAAQAGQEREEGVRAGQVARRAGAAGHGVPGEGQLPLDHHALHRPGHHRLQEPVLQRRPGRQDLLRIRDEDEGAVPGAASRRHQHRHHRRAHPDPGRQAEARPGVATVGH